MIAADSITSSTNCRHTAKKASGAAKKAAATTAAADAKKLVAKKSAAKRAAVKKAAPMIGMWVEAEAAANGGKIHPVTSREVERVLWEDATKIKVTPR